MIKMKVEIQLFKSLSQIKKAEEPRKKGSGLGLGEGLGLKGK